MEKALKSLPRAQLIQENYYRFIHEINIVNFIMKTSKSLAQMVIDGQRS